MAEGLVPQVPATKSPGFIRFSQVGSGLVYHAGVVVFSTAINVNIEVTVATTEDDEVLLLVAPMTESTGAKAFECVGGKG
jgi:galactokinase